MNFVPVRASDGLAFHVGGLQATNTAFISTSGQQIGTMFNTTGEIAFSFRSAYSFADRKVLPAPNSRCVFDVYDNSSEQYTFRIYTSSGRLTIAYSTGTYTPTLYSVPVGQEDLLFGRDVVAMIRIAWNSTSHTLYINGAPVQTTGYTRTTPNWSLKSSFTFGAQGSTSGPTGIFAVDDAVADFQIY